MRYWTLSLIYFGPTVTLPLERIHSVFLFTAGLSLKLKCLEELVTVIAAPHNIIKLEEKEKR
jgi:hypothetical protein